MKTRNDKIRNQEVIGMPETANQALKRWDEGKNLFTVEMGGLGPGYEQAIQVAIMEIIRAFVKRPSRMEWRYFWRKADKVLDHVDKDDSLGGLTGAMAGAAKSLSWRYLTEGWKATLDRPEAKDRLIQISKTFGEIRYRDPRGGRPFVFPNEPTRGRKVSLAVDTRVNATGPLSGERLGAKP